MTTQEGGAKYDPSTDGRHCGWSGPEASRCAEAGDSALFQSQVVRVGLKYVFLFTTYVLGGFMIQFDLRIFFEWVG